MVIQVIHKENKQQFNLSNQCGKFMTHMNSLGFGSCSQSGISSILQEIPEIKIRDTVFRKVD